MRKVLYLLVVLVCSAAAAFGQQASEGSLFAVGKKGNDLGACPLKTTAVKTDVSGFLARVNVRQEFQNSFAEPIEAVYVFPLSQNGAVDSRVKLLRSTAIARYIFARPDPPSREIIRSGSHGRLKANMYQLLRSCAVEDTRAWRSTAGCGQLMTP